MYDERLSSAYWQHENFEQHWLGTDAHHGEVTLLQRKGAPQVWYLHYYITWESIPHSGRWFAAPVTGTQIQALQPEQALSLLAESDCYYAGGSYFEGQILVRTGPPPIE